MMLVFFGLFVISVFMSYAESAIFAHPIKDIPELPNAFGLEKYSSIEKIRQDFELLHNRMDGLIKAGNKTVSFNLDVEVFFCSLFFANQDIPEEQIRFYFLIAEGNSTEVSNIFHGIVNNKTNLADTKTKLNSNNISIVTFHVENYLQLRDDLHGSLKAAKRNVNVFDVAIEIKKFRPVVNAFREALANVTAERGVVVVCGKQCPNEIEATRELMAVPPVTKKDLQAGIQSFQDFLGMESNPLTAKTIQELTGMEVNSLLVTVAEELLGKAQNSLTTEFFPSFFQVAYETVERIDDSKLLLMNEVQTVMYLFFEIFEGLVKRGVLSEKTLHGLMKGNALSTQILKGVPAMGNSASETASPPLLATTGTGFTTMRLGTILVVAVLALVV